MMRRNAGDGGIIAGEWWRGAGGLVSGFKGVLSDIRQTNEIQSVLFGRQSRALGPYLAGIHVILIPVMRLGGGVRVKSCRVRQRT
jgi:hypothetical protein